MSGSGRVVGHPLIWLSDGRNLDDVPWMWKGRSLDIVVEHKTGLMINAIEIYLYFSFFCWLEIILV